MHRRQAERVRVLGEGHGEASPVGVAPHLGGGQLGAPEGTIPRGIRRPLPRARAPLVDHPVVVGLHAQEREVLVLALEERLAAEAGERVGEADGRLDVVGRHVLEPLRLDPAAGRISSKVTGVTSRSSKSSAALPAWGTGYTRSS